MVNDNDIAHTSLYNEDDTLIQQNDDTVFDPTQSFHNNVSPITQRAANALHDALNCTTRSDHQSSFDLRRVAHLSRLTAGTTFMKYSKSGVHPRKVYLTDNLSHLCYVDPKKQDKLSYIKKINVNDIVDVVVGRDSTAVLNRHTIAPNKDHYCFSIILPDRTLDLEGDDIRQVHLYVNYLSMAAELNRLNNQHKQLQQYRSLKEERAIKSIQLWKSIVLPNWNNNSLKIKLKIRDIWLIGIPSNIRAAVWYRAIGNSLDITRELFDSFIRLARMNNELMRDSHASYVGMQDSVHALDADITHTFPELKFFHSAGPNLPGNALREILQATMLFRPDIGYMTGI